MTGLRFCFLTTFYPPYNFGGDGIAVQRFARGLVHAGHHVTVIGDADAHIALSATPAAAPEPEPEGLDVVFLRSALGRGSLLLTQQLGRPVVHGREIARRLQDGRFDVINFHNVSLVGGPGLLKYGTGLKVYTAHEHWLVCPTHTLWRHGRERCDGRECVRCQLSYRRPPQLWRRTGYLERELHHIDLFIAMSDFSRRKHAEFGFPREMEVLPAFLPDGGQRTATDGARAHARPYFLFVGRLERIKGVQDVFPLFAGEGPADLLIAGEGDFAAELRTRAEGMPRVRFLGHVPPADLERLYRDAIALVVPSLCFETFGIILIEAFRQSTPVIARRIGPFPEIVERSGGGLLFEGADELRAAMDRLRVDPAFRAQAATAGRKAFETHWHQSVVVPGYLSLVQRAAARKGDTRVARLAQA
jgi:glycosyltransferase involved in cell wall biosynthesis